MGITLQATQPKTLKPQITRQITTTNSHSEKIDQRNRHLERTEKERGIKGVSTKEREIIDRKFVKSDMQTRKT
jgi:hypothetical protein